MEDLVKRNRKKTEQKLIRAVGEVFRMYGYTGIKINKVARHAGVQKNLIYRYFGSVEKLFRTYLLEQDYWSFYQNNLDDILEGNKTDSGKNLAKNVLEKQLDYFYSNAEMQQVIRWEISEKNEISRGISDARERLGEEMLGLTDAYFMNSEVNFRALLALQIAGIYYFVLHAKVNGSTFCGIDINKESDMKELHRTLKQVVDWGYEKASK